MTTGSKPLVHVRMPTYKRPESLERAMRCLIDQTHDNWIADIYDDDREGSARLAVERVNDPRFHYHRNETQKFGSKNIDDCFSKENPRNADYFCVLEDDNLYFPTHFENSIAICEEKGVDLVFRNQLIEYDYDTPEARFSETGMLNDQFEEGLIAPEIFRLCLICRIGVSNGGLFWTRNTKTDLAIGFPITSTVQEYFRTFMLKDDIYIAMEPLASWAENGEATLRRLGENTGGYLKRELDQKRHVQILQHRAWRAVSPDIRADFLEGRLFRYSEEERAMGLAKALIRFLPKGTGLKEGINQFGRGCLIRFGGRVSDVYRQGVARVEAETAPGARAET